MNSCRPGLYFSQLIIKIILSPLLNTEKGAEYNELSEFRPEGFINFLKAIKQYYYHL